MTFAQRRNRLTTHFSERIAFAKRRMTMYVNTAVASCCQPVGYILTTYQTHKAVCSTMLQLTCTFWTLFHGTVFTQSHLAGHNMHTVKTSGIHRVCVPNLRIVQCTCSHTMVLCRRVHHSHTLRSQILTAPIPKLGNLRVWKFVCTGGALYSEKKNARVAGTLSPILPTVFGATRLARCWRCVREWL